MLANTIDSVETPPTCWPAAVRAIEALLARVPDSAAENLRFAFRDACNATGLDGLFIFGSAARGEHAVDLDWIAVSSKAEAAHLYSRIRVRNIECDLNLVNIEWIRNAWRDPEWGYWLAEAFPLAGSRAVIDTWQASANAYWNRSTSVARTTELHGILRELATGSRGAPPLSARLLGHEAVRVSVIALIDRYGRRPFSHRTFVEEATLAAKAAAIDLRQLAGALGASPDDYLGIRHWISELLRSHDVESRGFNRGANMKTRMSSLCELARSAALEHMLIRRQADQVLPQLGSALEHCEQAFLRLERSSPRVSKRHVQLEVPRPATKPGVRWIEHVGPRLKVIVGTGGCRTPTCHFCSLPQFGRSVERFDFGALGGMLERTRATSVALYNDGSLLNPDEVSPMELEVLCDTLRRNGVRELQIESIPRFVFRGQLEQIKEAGALETLWIAMGLQAVGNAFARLDLGRPDVDAVFDRALVDVREAGARARLYLMWGFGPSTAAAWRQHLRDSLAWARHRFIDRITICPFVEAGRGSRSLVDSICELRHALVELGVPPGGLIDVSIPVRASCGIEYAGASCLNCQEALRMSTWTTGPACRIHWEMRDGPP